MRSGRRSAARSASPRSSARTSVRTARESAWVSRLFTIRTWSRSSPPTSIRSTRPTFHTYAASWTADGVDFLLDGEVVKSTTQSPDYPMQLMLAIYEFPDRIVPDRAPSTGHRAAYPKPFVVDWVRGYG